MVARTVALVAGVAGVVGGVGWLTKVFAALDGLLSPIPPQDHWFAEEIEIVAMAVIGPLLAGWAGTRRRGRSAPAT